MGYTVQEKSIVDFCESKTESLSNWVRKVKCKSLNAKTKRKRDLRVIAILSNSLFRAENELLHKQRERARRWAQMQADLGLNSKEEEAAKQHREKIDNFWKNDLSGLDNFFRELDNVKPIVKQQICVSQLGPIAFRVGLDPTAAILAAAGAWSQLTTKWVCKTSSPT
ncbi:unnamed protein product [Danaus chrysippus]|uniref:(African queen) hypothetical protein n=1 Tax=Danaus chrysippus TaxID=151541 RepID=A0A8J2QM34_9NEOP|nr:unnamed protein product [Danaus chrysippus]